MFKSKISYLAAVATALLAAGAHAGALTQGSNVVPSRTVWFGDLDLTTPQGISTLHHRIIEAARAVCPQADSTNLSQLALAHACQNQAVDRAVSAVGNPMLANMAASRQMLVH